MVRKEKRSILSSFSYLPPLSDVSLEKWKFVIFMQSRQNHINPENELIILNDMDKLKV
jgi:hypothetical protein